jgi:hypothetical protein
VVGLGIFFQDLASLSDVDQTLDADVLVVARWRDPRLADPARGDASVECPLPEGRLWMPPLEPENHAWKLGVPLTLIVLMAYGVYFIPATAVPQQIGLGTTSMLTLIAYMLALGSTLPRISYLTRADRFFVGSAVLVFLGLVKAVAAIALAQRQDVRVIDRVSRWGRWVFPIAMLANFVLAFVF